MSVPQRIAALADCREHFERASISLHGIRVAFKSYGDANLFTLRMQTLRKLEREEMERMYPSTSPQWGKTDWDHLMVRKPKADDDGMWWVYIEPPGKNIVVIEDLTEEDAS